jgi:hypothetical protein
MCSMMKWCPFEIVIFIDFSSAKKKLKKNEKLILFLVTNPHVRRN